MDYKKAVEQKEKDITDLYQRMDDDKTMLYLDPYKMKDIAGEKVRNVVNVTHNRPAVFAANVISALGSTKEQPVVESEDRNVDTALIEEFLDSAFSMADERRRKQGLPALNDFFDFHSCIRGRLAARCYCQIENGVLIPDIQTWDTRKVSYDTDQDGIPWAAYRMPRSAEDIKAEYAAEYKDVLPSFPSSKTVDVLDVWHRDGNEVWIGGKKVREQEHGLSYTPVAIDVVTLGSLLMDSDRIKHEGESIFFLIRPLITELNRLLSIMQTLNQAAVSRAVLWKTRSGTELSQDALPSHEDLTGMGSVTAADIEGGADPVNLGDIQRATLYCLSEINKALQEGSLPTTMMGTLGFPLSAVALVELHEGVMQVFQPRLNNKASMKEQLAGMIIDQVINSGERQVSLGRAGHKRTFDVSKLEGEYDITYKYFVKSPKVDIARYSIAATAREFLDEDTILEDILQVEDPARVKQEKYKELAAKLDPNVLRHRIIMNLLKLAKDGDKQAMAEAKIMAISMGISFEQLEAGNVPLIEPEETKAPSNLLPLMEEGTPRGSAQKSAQLQKMPEEELGD